uniref:Uncharacterized protein n=1 Tax=Parascaris univalens TaxID=6257 RepID=A0A915AQT3_PARUN
MKQFATGDGHQLLPVASTLQFGINELYFNFPFLLENPEDFINSVIIYWNKVEKKTALIW